MKIIFFLLHKYANQLASYLQNFQATVLLVYFKSNNQSSRLVSKEKVKNSLIHGFIYNNVSLN